MGNLHPSPPEVLSFSQLSTQEPARPDPPAPPAIGKLSPPSDCRLEIWQFGPQCDSVFNDLSSLEQLSFSPQSCYVVLFQFSADYKFETQSPSSVEVKKLVQKLMDAVEIDSLSTLIASGRVPAFGTGIPLSPRAAKAPLLPPTALDFEVYVWRGRGSSAAVRSEAAEAAVVVNADLNALKDKRRSRVFFVTPQSHSSQRGGGRLARMVLSASHGSGGSSAAIASVLLSSMSLITPRTFSLEIKKVSPFVAALAISPRGIRAYPIGLGSHGTLSQKDKADQNDSPRKRRRGRSSDEPSTMRQEEAVLNLSDQEVSREVSQKEKNLLAPHYPEPPQWPKKENNKRSSRRNPSWEDQWYGCFECSPRGDGGSGGRRGNSRPPLYVKKLVDPTDCSGGENRRPRRSTFSFGLRSPRVIEELASHRLVPPSPSRTTIEQVRWSVDHLPPPARGSVCSPGDMVPRQNTNTLPPPASTHVSKSPSLLSSSSSAESSPGMPFPATQFGKPCFPKLAVVPLLNFDRLATRKDDRQHRASLLSVSGGSAASFLLDSGRKATNPPLTAESSDTNSQQRNSVASSAGSSGGGMLHRHLMRGHCESDSIIRKCFRSLDIYQADSQFQAASDDSNCSGRTSLEVGSCKEARAAKSSSFRRAPDAASGGSLQGKGSPASSGRCVDDPTRKQSALLRAYKRVLTEVVPGSGLFLGGAGVASDLRKLKAAGITHIVNLSVSQCPSAFPRDFDYLSIKLEDLRAASELLQALLPNLLRYIRCVLASDVQMPQNSTSVLLRSSDEENVDRRNSTNSDRCLKGRVLVHCLEGVSRSATVVLAYLMWVGGVGFRRAFSYLRKRRPTCNPNTGFTFALLKLERAFNKARRQEIEDGGRTLLSSPSSGRAEQKLYRIIPHTSNKKPFLIALGLATKSNSNWLPPLPFTLDPRFVYILTNALEDKLVVWVGQDAVKVELARQFVTNEFIPNAVEFEGSGVCRIVWLTTDSSAEETRELFWNNFLPECKQSSIQAELNEQFCILKEDEVSLFSDILHLLKKP